MKVRFFCCHIHNLKNPNYSTGFMVVAPNEREAYKAADDHMFESRLVEQYELTQVHEIEDDSDAQR